MENTCLASWLMTPPTSFRHSLYKVKKKLISSLTSCWVHQLLVSFIGFWWILYARLLQCPVTKEKCGLYLTVLMRTLPEYLSLFNFVKYTYVKEEKFAVMLQVLTRCWSCSHFPYKNFSLNSKCIIPHFFLLGNQEMLQ